MDYASYLNFAVQIAYQAGRITLGYFNTGVPVEYKEDETPVTEADRAAEAFIRKQIKMAFPDHGILGEEMGGEVGERNSIRWIIDPIDGTKSFMRGVPLYAVLLGLEMEGEVRVGAAYFPALDEMLCAADGLGCWWNGRRAYTSKVAALEKAVVCYTNASNFSRYGRQGVLDRLMARVYACRGWGDAYGYLLVATGRAEAMFDPAMKIWDCGPFPPIFREAGGYFGSWDGKSGHTSGEAMASSNTLLPELLELIEEPGS